MRENRPSGSEGGGTLVLPTPISGGEAVMDEASREDKELLLCFAEKRLSERVRHLGHWYRLLQPGKRVRQLGD